MIFDLIALAKGLVIVMWVQPGFWEGGKLLESVMCEEIKNSITFTFKVTARQNWHLNVLPISFTVKNAVPCIGGWNLSYRCIVGTTATDMMTRCRAPKYTPILKGVTNEDISVALFPFDRPI